MPPEMTPRGDRSIRNISVEHARRPTPPSAPTQSAPIPPQHQLPPQRPAMRPPRRGGGWVWWALTVALLCFAIGLGLATLFERAAITLHPREVSVPAQTPLTAYLNAPSNELGYQTITATQIASTSVPANGTEQVSRAAVGLATITNAYSSAPQKLAANTRLATDDGKVYRLKSAVVVPGMQGSDPGATTASIYADKPGAEYNQPAPVALSIVGYKGDPRYTKVTAESIGPIQDGFVGEEPAVAPNDLAAAENSLKQQLDASIRSVAASQIPDGFMAVNGSLGISYSGVTQTQGPDSTAILSQSVSATLPILRKSDVAAALAQHLNVYSGNPIDFAQSVQPSVSLAGTSTSNGQISLTVDNSPILVWQLNTDALKAAFLGKPKSQFETILGSTASSTLECDSSHPCTATIRPFWKETFPADPSKLSLTVVE